MTAKDPDPVAPAEATSGEGQPDGRRVLRVAIWLPGLAVAIGAAAATAHGLYEVAVASRVPSGIAWLYPLITDGLALVAYAATARLRGSASRYAWLVVIVAAGLSGLAQAVFLASPDGLEASPVVRFGIGAWPAVAAAIVAHLLYLLAVEGTSARQAIVYAEDGTSSATALNGESVQPDRPIQDIGVQPSDVQAAPIAVQPASAGAFAAPPVQASQPSPARPALAPTTGTRSSASAPEAPARSRAVEAARRHAARTGGLPTVSELEALAEVSRGTAAAALKTLRNQAAPLRLLAGHGTETTETRPHR